MCERARAGGTPRESIRPPAARGILVRTRVAVVVACGDGAPLADDEGAIQRQLLSYTDGSLGLMKTGMLPVNRRASIVCFLVAATTICGSPINGHANLPDSWLGRAGVRGLSGDWSTHGALPCAAGDCPCPERANSSFGHCLVAATVRCVFKGARSLKPDKSVTLRGMCVGLNEKTAGIPISVDAMTPALQDLRVGQLVEAWFHDIILDQGNANFTTRLRVIPALTNTPRDSLPPAK
jgi:hypothetical protein